MYAKCVARPNLQSKPWGLIMASKLITEPPSVYMQISAKVLENMQIASRFVTVSGKRGKFTGKFAQL